MELSGRRQDAPEAQRLPSAAACVLGGGGGHRYAPLVLVLLLTVPVRASDTDQAVATITAGTADWHARLAERGGGAEALGLHLVLRAAHRGHDLRLTLRRHAGSWLPTTAEEDRRDGDRHAATVTDARASDGRFTATVRLAMAIPPEQQFGVITRTATAYDPVHLHLDLTFDESGQVSGVFRDHPTQPSVVDTVTGFWADAAHPAALCELRLIGALNGKALHLLALQRGERLHCLRALAPNWNKSRHLVDPTPLAITAGRVAAELPVTLIGDGWVPKDTARLRCPIALDLALAASSIAITGSYTVPAVHDQVPEVTGTVTGLRRPLVASDAATAPPVPNADDLAARVAWAEDCLAAVRAIEVALRSGEPLPLARATADVPRVAGADVATLQQRLVDIATILRAARDEDEPAIGNVHPDDPAFGPWYQPEPAPRDDVGRYRAADLAAAGWHQLDVWRVCGPMPRHPRPPAERSRIPPLVRSGTPFARCDDPRIPAAANPDQRWIWRPAEAADGMLDPGGLTHPFAAGMTGYRYLAASTVRCAQDRPRAWLALRSDTAHHKWGPGDRPRLRLWVDGRLRWTSDDAQRQTHDHLALVPVALTTGDTHLVIEVDGASDDALGFSSHLCLDGAPRPAETVAAWEERRRQALAADPLPRARGFRGDLRGRFADADPVPAWNLETGVNVRWRVSLPSFSNATPLPLGDRVITLCEPHHIYCFAIDDGRELWHRSASPFDELPPKEAAGLRRAANEYERLEQTRKQLRKKIKDLDRGQEAARAELEAELAATEVAWKRARRAVEAGRIAGATWGRFMGRTFASPVSDGERFWVKISSGVVACFTPEGERLWQIREDVRPNVYETSSPVLIGDLLICRWNGKKSGGHHRRSSHYVAYDADTGAVRWRREIAARTAGGTPLPLRLSDGDDLVDVLVTPVGAILRAADGAVLLPAREWSASAGWTIVSAEDDRVVYPMYYAQMASERLLLRDRDTLGARPLWHPIWWGGGSHHFFTGDYAVLHDGRAYANTVVKEHDLKHPCPWQLLNVVDLQTGRLDLRIKPVLRDCAHCYTPPTIAGDYLFLVDSGDPSSGCFPGRPGGPAAESAIAVLDLAHDTRPVAFNLMPRMQAPPAFAGDALFARTMEELICIGVTGDDGLAYVDEMRARQLFDELKRTPFPPRQDDIVDLAPALTALPAAIPVARLQSAAAKPPLLLAHPVTEAVDMTVLGRRVPKVGDTVGDAALRLLDTDLIGGDGSLRRVELDYLAAFDKRRRTAGWFATVLHIGRERVVVYKSKPQAATYLGGRAIASGDRLRLHPGYYPLYHRLEVGNLPPGDLRIYAEFAFQPADDPATAWRAWAAHVERYRRDLAWAVQRFDGSRFAFQARRYLDLLDEHGAATDPR